MSINKGKQVKTFIEGLDAGQALYKEHSRNEGAEFLAALKNTSTQTGKSIPDLLVNILGDVFSVANQLDINLRETYFEIGSRVAKNKGSIRL